MDPWSEKVIGGKSAIHSCAVQASVVDRTSMYISSGKEEAEEREHVVS